MTMLGAVYSVDRHVRTPTEVLAALFQDGAPHPAPAPQRPVPQHKRMRALLVRDDAGTTAPQTTALFQWLAEEYRQRNPAEARPGVLLMDGQENLWYAGATLLPSENITEFIDILHVSEYVWAAAALFETPGSAAATTWAKTYLGRLLHGEVNTVIQDLQRLGEARLRRRPARDALARILGYFANNRHRMAYDLYLAEGLPIASGVIEGACRWVVKDRMERSGMRWVMAGAQLSPGLRAPATVWRASG